MQKAKVLENFNQYDPNILLEREFLISEGPSPRKENSRFFGKIFDANLWHSLNSYKNKRTSWEFSY